MLIRTKYLGPTDTKGSRVKGTTVGRGGSEVTFTAPWDYSVDTAENHEAVATEVVRKVERLWISEHGSASVDPANPVIRLSDWTPDGFVHIFSYRSQIQEVTL